jgi:hypothetical protein
VSDTDATPAPAPRNVFVPGLLLALAVAGWSAFQCWQLVVERNNLAVAIAGQDAQMEQSQKVRAALENIATKTARIARAGNANATLVVEELRKRGITINPDGPLPGEQPLVPAAPAP